VTRSCAQCEWGRSEDRKMYRIPTYDYDPATDVPLGEFIETRLMCREQADPVAVKPDHWCGRFRPCEVQRPAA
jgi:hypothetical protein